MLVLTAKTLCECDTTQLYGKSDPAGPLHLNHLLELRPSGTMSPILVADTTSSIICVAMGETVHIGMMIPDDVVATRCNIRWNEMAVQTSIKSLAFSQDILALGERSGDIHVYFDTFKSLERGERPTETLIKWHTSPVSALEFSLNGCTYFSIRLKFRPLPSLWR